MTHHNRSFRAFARTGAALALLSTVFVADASSGASSGDAWPTPAAKAMADRLLATTARGNGLIAFTSNRDGNKEIYSMFIDGLSQTDLSNNPADDFQAAWSPGGDKIAFTSTRSGNNDIWVMDPDGSSPVNLTNNAANDSQAAWSPDGLEDRLHQQPQRDQRHLGHERQRLQPGPADQVVRLREPAELQQHRLEDRLHQRQGRQP